LYFFAAVPEKLSQYIITRDELRAKESKALANGQDVLVEQFGRQAEQLDKIITGLQGSMKKEDTKASRICTLKKTQEARKQDCLLRVDKAIERLQKIGAKLNFHSIAKEANLSVSYLYKYPELKQRVAQLRSQQSSMPISPVAKPASSSHAIIVSRLKERIGQLEQQHQELRRKNEALAGQVYRFHHLQEQVERQQQTIEDLQSRLKEQERVSSVAKVTSIAQAKSRQGEM
jgi:predicted RNase H-like nuclease (RuvC/YqgF family)